MTKLDFVHEACDTTFISIPDLTTGELTILVNACHEAAAWRAENKLPHVEKLVRMEEKLKRYNEELDKKIDDKCGELLEEAKRRKRLEKRMANFDKVLAEYPAQALLPKLCGFDIIYSVPRSEPTRNTN